MTTEQLLQRLEELKQDRQALIQQIIALRLKLEAATQHAATVRAEILEVLQ